MESFYYYNPTKIIFGRDSIRKIPKEIPGGSRILMISGQGSAKQNGVYEQVQAALKDYEVFEFAGVEPNPDYDTCQGIVQKIRETNAGYLLAVGGGSVIDATKFAALAVFIKGDPWEFIAGRGEAPTRALPFGCIQTCPGSGSEMNNAFVISRRLTGDKIVGVSFFTYPKFSVLDPQITCSLSAKQSANGVVDMFVHVLEQYITSSSTNILQERQAEGLLLTMKEVGPQVLERPDDYYIRANIMWCSANALNGTLSRGVLADWATHNIGHVLTSLYDLDHAQTLAIVIGRVWRKTFDKKKLKLAQYAQRVWNLSGDLDDVARKAIYKTEGFFESMGMATRLSECGLNSQDVAEKVAAKFGGNGMMLGEHHDIDSEQIREILLSC